MTAALCSADERPCRRHHSSGLCRQALPATLRSIFHNITAMLPACAPWQHPSAAFWHKGADRVVLTFMSALETSTIPAYVASPFFQSLLLCQPAHQGGFGSWLSDAWKELHWTGKLNPMGP